MTENIPPNSQATNADATRGVPYYEKLKRDLREIIQKKRLLDKNMVRRKSSEPTSGRYCTDPATGRSRRTDLPLRRLVS
jgi:hypothetical protein